jgi:pimeloyl-ACP methyl ester carboxylesterase
MLLLHGALGAASQFEPLRNALPDTLSVHAPDFMGHGSRALPGSPFSILRLVDQVVELIESQGLQGTPCFGYSMGGYVALVIAATRPGLLGQVTTLATRFAWSPDVTAREMAQLDPDVIAAKVPRFATTLEARHVAAGWRQLCAATARLLQELGDAPLLNDAVFSRITIPVKVMVGDRDAMVSIEETVGAFRAIPAAQLAVLPGVPHPLERVPVPMIVRELLPVTP